MFIHFTIYIDFIIYAYTFRFKTYQFRKIFQYFENIIQAI